MSLQTKFTVLVTLLAATTAIILGAALSFGVFLERELVKPFERVTSSLRGLEELKRATGELIAMLPGPGRDEPGLEFYGSGTADSALAPDAAHRGRYDEVYANVEIALRRLEFDPAWRASVGAGTSEALAGQVGAAHRAAEKWYDGGAVEDGRRAGEEHYRIHELVEAIEKRLIDDSPTALAYGADLQRIHLTMTYSGIAAAVLFGVLCVMLFRRWVIQPVRLLREAAVRIGEGDFSHRVVARSADELGVLSGEVNRMAGLVGSMQAEAVEKERLVATGEMVRRLAHNIRNPLSAIRGLAELSRRRAVSDEAVRQNQSEIIESVDRFNTWLTDLLSVTAPKGVVPEEVKIGPWLTALVESHRPLARMRSVEMSSGLRGLTHARFDPRHMEQAVVAILANAIQASPAGGQVRVEAARDGEMWTIAISDQGPGVPADLVDKIFRPYFTTKRDGTGIGLAISREVVKAHGGEIAVDSAENGGSIFRVRLPIGMIQPADAADNSHVAVISQEQERNGIDSDHRR